jgi:hypothetical protein
MNTGQHERRRCTGKNRAGKPCGRPPIRGGFVCPKHGGGLPNVKAKAAQRIRDLLADAIDPDRAMREAAAIAYSDLRELFDEAGNLRPPKDWPDHLAAAIASVEVIKKNVTTGDGKVDDVFKVRLWPKDRAVEWLMKHHGHLVEKVEHSGSVNIVDRLVAARKRVSSGRR